MRTRHHRHDGVTLLAGTLAATPAAAQTPTSPPPGANGLPVEWIRVSAPSGAAIVAAIARPSGRGPFPTVLVLHGTHGFAREYVQLARELAGRRFPVRGGVLVPGGGGVRQGRVAAHRLSRAIPPLGPGDYLEGIPIRGRARAGVTGLARREG
jgi:hypothetical protein